MFEACFIFTLDMLEMKCHSNTGTLLPSLWTWEKLETYTDLKAQDLKADDNEKGESSIMQIYWLQFEPKDPFYQNPLKKRKVPG